jgi:hypothetical protein
VIVRSFRAALVAASALMVLPLGAQAKSQPSVVQGTLLSSTRPVIGQTGNCVCEAQYFTVGLKPGKVTVSIQLTSIGQKLGQSYSMKADLERRNRTTLGMGQNACWRSDTKCRLHFTFTAKVYRAAPYYVHVQGEGGEGMQYRIQVQGPIYRVK